MHVFSAALGLEMWFADSTVTTGDDFELRWRKSAGAAAKLLMLHGVHVLFGLERTAQNVYTICIPTGAAATLIMTTLCSYSSPPRSVDLADAGEKAQERSGYRFTSSQWNFRPVLVLHEPSSAQSLTVQRCLSLADVNPLTPGG